MRIVSLLPSLTESVCAVGACTRLVGTDRYSNWPTLVVALPKLGGIEDVSLEQIATLHPDVVLTSRVARGVDRLEELGIPVVALEATTLADVHRVLLVVGRLVSSTERGEAAWLQIQAQINVAARRIPSRWRGKRVFFEVSEAPHAASAGSFIGELLALLGLSNAVPANLGPFPQLNPEYIVRAQPDLIMASERELGTMASRPGWSELQALRRGNTCGLESARFEVLVRPGPRLGEAAEEIADCLSGLNPRAAQ